MQEPLHHFYHIYADGNWQEPVADHLKALRITNLEVSLASINIGFVGSDENVTAVKEYLSGENLLYEEVAQETSGWEQVTLSKLEEFIQTNTGLVSYAHTKGAANFAEVNRSWRLSMEYYNFVVWHTPVNALNGGKVMAGTHWIETPTAKFFGGTYWWARIDALRQNEPLTYHTRHDAEHWIGLLDGKIPLVPGSTLLDMLPNTPIAIGYLKDDWM